MVPCFCFVFQWANHEICGCTVGSQGWTIDFPDWSWLSCATWVLWSIWMILRDRPTHSNGCLFTVQLYSRLFTHPNHPESNTCRLISCSICFYPVVRRERFGAMGIYMFPICSRFKKKREHFGATRSFPSTFHLCSLWSIFLGPSCKPPSMVDFQSPLQSSQTCRNSWGRRMEHRSPGAWHDPTRPMKKNPPDHHTISH